MHRSLQMLVTVATTWLLFGALTPVQFSYGLFERQGLSNSSSSVVIALDTSQSMSGPKLRQAIQLIQGIVDSAGPTDSIGVIGFGNVVSTLAPTTRDHALALSALRTVDLTQGTRLMDGIRAASKATDPAATNRVVVVISDGEDSGIPGDMDKLVSDAKREKVSFYSIDLGRHSLTPKALVLLARETGGTSTEAPQQSVRDSTQLSQSTPARGNTSRYGNAMLGPLVSLPFAVLLALIPVWLRRGRNARIHRKLLLTFEQPPHASTTISDARFQRARKLGRLEQIGEPLGLPYVDRLLERANVPLSQTEALIMMSGLLLVGLLVGALWGGVLAILVPAILVALPLLILRVMSSRRRAAFDRQLPSLLTSLASSLRVGHSFLQGLTAAIADAPEPLRTEFQFAMTESRFGRPLESALQSMAARLKSKEFNLVVTVVAIQRQVGGSLAPMIEIVGETLQERLTFSKRLRALTSQGKASALVLVAMPIVIGVVLNLMSPDFMAPLLHTSQGQTMIIASAVWMSIGGLFIHRIVSYKG